MYSGPCNLIPLHFKTSFYYIHISNTYKYPSILALPSIKEILLAEWVVLKCKQHCI